MKKEKNPKSRRVLLSVLGGILVIVLALVIAATAYTEKLLNLMNRNPDDSTMSSSEYQAFINSQTETADPNFTGPTINPEDIQWDVNTDTVTGQEHIINIMLIGQDRRPGQGRQRSDVMLLCTVNTATKELTMTSFLRDLYVPIPGYADNRMNATYAFGGMKLLSKCMETNFGIHVDGNLEVDFDRFTGVIDLIGGVDMYLTNSEANYMTKYGVSAQSGMNHLDGKAALAYTRNRAVGNGDFSRTERQRKVVSAVLDKCKTMSVAQLKELTEQILPMITTDLSNRQILDYVGRLLPILGQLKVTSQRVPADGTYQYASIRGMSVLVPDLEANREILKKMTEK